MKESKDPVLPHQLDIQQKKANEKSENN